MPLVKPTSDELAALDRLMDLAIDEDLGSVGDVTSLVTIDEATQGQGMVVQKQPGIVAGLGLAGHMAERFDRRLEVALTGEVEGAWQDQVPQPIFTIAGPMRSILAAERTMLNVLSHLSGIATLTRRFADEVRGTDAKIYDTRKTLPGYRRLHKLAVRIGGGANHRMGLFDMVLVKDNHLAAADDLVAGLVAAVETTSANFPATPIEVEVDTLDQLGLVLSVEGIDVILLDNFAVHDLQRAVEMRRDARSCVALEASGGVTLDTVAAIARTGVERIAVGALTHSAVGLDIGLDVKSTG